ncbi:MAG: nucleotidyltransferase family protein [Planctomycetales bacterium]|nr:nucleotidyltransferase family protein [Planctomycetales bacterium]
MGEPKLLLLWRGAPLVEHVIRAYQTAGIDKIVAVVHPEDETLAAVCRALGAEAVRPAHPPAEMKDSVRLALEFARGRWNPAADAVWLLAPADLPGLSPEVVFQLLAAADEQPDRILTPVHQGRTGHPALFPWSLAQEVATLSAGQGVNALVARHAPVPIECGPAAVCRDVDTPEDYQRLHEENG